MLLAAQTPLLDGPIVVLQVNEVLLFHLERQSHRRSPERKSRRLREPLREVLKGHGCEGGGAGPVDRRRRQLPPDGDGVGLLLNGGVGHDPVPHHGRPLLLLHRRHRRDVVGNVVWHGVVAVEDAEVKKAT